MSRTLKSMLDTVMLECGLGTESAYATATKDSVKRVFGLANRSIQTLAQYPWQELRKTYEFTLSTDTEYPLPDDYRRFVSDTIFAQNRTVGVDFPAGATEWGYLKATTGGNGPRFKVRLLGNVLQVHDPEDGETLRIEYVSKYPVVEPSGGLGQITKELFTADTDTCLLDDDLLERDIIWRHKKLLGLQDWSVDLQETKEYEKVLKGNNQGAKTIYPDQEVEFATPYYELWRPSPNT